MKIACQEGLIPGQNFEEKLANAEKLGLEGIELSGRGIEERAAHIKSLLPSYTVKISSICSGYRGDLLGAEKSQRALAIQDIKARLEIAAQLGAVGVIVVPTFGKPKLPDLYPLYLDVWTLERQLIIAELKELGKYADEVGAYVLLEPLNRYETHFVNTLEQATAIIDEVGCEHVKVMADFFHMNIEETDIPSSLRRAGSRLKHVHLADSNRLLPGLGHTDFAAAFKVLKEIGYSDYMAFECRAPEPRMQSLRNSINFLREIMGKI